MAAAIYVHEMCNSISAAAPLRLPVAHLAASTHSKALWIASDLPTTALDRLHLTHEPDPAVNSSFKIGTVAQTTIGLSGLSAAYFHQLRTGEEQDVTVEARHAVLEFCSEAWYTLDGSLPRSETIWDELAGIYETKDGYVRIHTNFPQQSITASLTQWNSVEFETETASHGMCATALRSFDEWDNHAQAEALRGVPPVEIIRVGHAPHWVTDKNLVPRHLDGIRVLDLTRVLAGPVCGRTLAAHVADVLLITSPSLPALPLLDADTSRGKRTSQLDLNLPSDRSTLATLIKDADVFLQAYRPEGLGTKGFSVQDVVNTKPGIVYAGLNAYGWEGPWKDRRGFDSLVQTASGFNVAESQAYASFTGQTSANPRPLPMQALDHAAGYLLAFGINAALSKTVTEGGSWEVRVSLAAVSEPLPPRILPQDPEIAKLAVSFRKSKHSGGGKMTAIKHAAILSKTPVNETDAPVVLNAHEPIWLPRC